MKRVLVTGATGFTGSYLCKALIRKGYHVSALVKASSAAKLKSLFPGNQLTVVTGDLSEPDNLKNILTDIDTVYHIAALYRQEGVSKDLFFKINLEGTRALLDEAVRANVSTFLHCSTVGVQGEISNPPATEEAPFKPGDHYQQSKLEGEKLALSYFKSNKINGVVVRPVGIYGPGDDRFLKLFRHIYNGSFKMIGKGSALYHLTFVEDLVEGIILAAEAKGVNGEVFTLGGPEYLPLEELVGVLSEIMNKKVSSIKIPLFPVYVAATLCEWVCRPFGIEPPIFRRRLDFFTKDRAFDITKAKNALGFQPRVSLKEGLTRTFEWYKNEGWLDK